MSKFKDNQVLDFSLEGRFLGFMFKDGDKLKRLRLDTLNGEYAVQLSKQARLSFDQTLIPGNWIQVAGKKKLNLKTGEIKLKADAIAVSASTSPALVTTLQATPKPKSSILVCQRLDCMKRGGRAVCQALKSAVNTCHLEDQITIQETGCMKRCQAGPNLIFMPDRTRYSSVRPGEIPELVAKHFPCEANIESKSNKPTTKEIL